MATDSSRQPDRIRDTLDKLGRERSALNERELELHDDIAKVLHEAEGIVPKTEVARRLGLHRTTLYRVYG